MYRLAAKRPLTLRQGAVVAVLTTGAAWAVRAALQPVLGDQAVFTTFLGATLITGVVSDWRNATVAALLGMVLAHTLFKEMTVGVYAATVIYCAVAGYMIYLIQGLTSSLRREINLRRTLDAVSHEYQHRIKNLLAVTQAVVHQTGRSTNTVSDFSDKVADRLDALARAQDMLVEDLGAAPPLRTVISQSLAPFDIEARLAAPLAGPDVWLASDTAVAFVMLINELATNATKYGALSTPEGRLRLTWSVSANVAEIEWKEVGGPTVVAPTRRGLGSRLVERVLPHGAKAQLTFEPDGARCVIRLNTQPHRHA